MDERQAALKKLAEAGVFSGQRDNESDLLGKAARIAYDMIVSGRSAKEVSVAILALKAATTSALTNDQREKYARTVFDTLVIHER